MSNVIDELKNNSKNISNLQSGYEIAEYLKRFKTINPTTISVLFEGLVPYCLNEKQLEYFDKTRSLSGYIGVVEKYLNNDKNSNPIAYLAEIISEYEKIPKEQKIKE